MSDEATVWPPDDDSWVPEGLCFEHDDPDMWYEDEDEDRIAEAKEICGECTVRDQCLRAGLFYGEPYGIWGGLTVGERRRASKNLHGTPQKAWRGCKDDDGNPCPACAEVLRVRYSQIRARSDSGGSA